MKTRNRQQQEIDWLNEKVQLLERIIELEKQLRVFNPQPIYIPYPYQPWIPTTLPTTWIGDTTSQAFVIDDQCQVFMTS